MKGVLNSFTNLWIKNYSCTVIRLSASLRKAEIPNFSHLQGWGLMKFRISSKYSLRKGRAACFSHLQGCGRLMQPAPANYKDAEGWGRLHRTIKNGATCT